MGAGGHAKVVADTLLDTGANIRGFVDRGPKKSVDSILGIAVIFGETFILNLDPSEVRLCNGVGYFGRDTHRRDVYESFAQKGYVFEQVVHPSAIIGREVNVGNGAQIFAGTIVQSGTSVGADTIINTAVSVDHDCVIGDHVHIAPGAKLSGDVSIGNEVMIGTGASVIHGISIGARSIVGAGAAVIRNVTADTVAVGTPARERTRK